MSSLFTDLKHRTMKDIKRKLEQLTYEIKLVKSDEPDRMTGVMIRLEELTDLVNKLLIPDVSQRSELLSDFEKWLNKQGNESYYNLPAGYVVDKYKSLNCG